MSTLAENVHTKLIITYSEQRAREIEENYRFFDRKTALFPAKDFIFYQADVHSNLIERQRIQALKALCDRQPVTVITTIQALMNHGMPFDEWKKAAFTLKAGDELDLSACEQQLVRMGYERTAQVNGPGSLRFAAAFWTFSRLPGRTRAGLNFSATRLTVSVCLTLRHSDQSRTVLP